MIKIKKTISIIIVTLFLLTRTIPVLGYEVPQPPAPSSPEAPTAPEAPEAPTAPTYEQAVSPAPEPEATEGTEPDQETVTETQETNSPTPTTTPARGTEQFTGTVSDGNSGRTEIITGDAVNTANLITSANTNINVAPKTNESGISSNNSENGSGSTNDSSLSLSESSSAVQENNAEVGNWLDLLTTTGSNSASQNLGDSKIVTGNADTAAVVVTAANTNIDGVAVAEFNISDDHTGDIILDFSSAISAGNESTTFQENNAELENNLYLSSNSGDNETSLNTGGESEINTGNANVAANVISFLNNNIAGNVVLGVVNIFGNLAGDIILPEGAFGTASAGSGSVQNVENGSESENKATIADTSESSTTQTNQAEIENNLNLKTNTGGNEASRNTGGETEVITGDSNIETRTVNVANSNIEGGNLWLVIINEAGKWIGRIIGAPEDSSVAGSVGMELTVDEKGNVIVQNNENGSNSSNDSEVTNEKSTQTEQSNSAKIVNNINLEANTGNNKANDNTGGDSSIQTGDANIIANIINFVNNNISSDGRILVAIVNVFGNWLGDFLPPGAQKEKPAPVGGNDDSGEEIADSDREESNDEDYYDDYLWDLEEYYWDPGESEVPETEEIAGVYYKKNNFSLGSSGKTAEDLGEPEPVKIDGDRFLSVEAASDNNLPKDKIKINLAWLSLAVPLFGLTALIKRLIKR